MKLGRHRIHRIGASLLAAVLLAMIGSQVTLAAGISWTAPSTVASTGSGACDHSLAASTVGATPRLHAAWRTPSVGYLTDPPLVYYRASANNGASWGSPVRLSGLSKTWKGCPLVAASGAFVVVAWTQGGTRSIRMRVSQDGGGTWSPEHVVPTTRTPGEPSLAVVGTRIYLAWTDAGAAPHWPRYMTSSDRGINWTGGRLESVAAASTSSWAVTTQIAVSGSTIFAAWVRSNATDLMGRWSTNGGASWTAPMRIAVLSAAALSRGFSIAARPDRLAVAWSDEDRATADASPLVHVRTYSAGAWHDPTTLTAVPLSGAYGWFQRPIVTLLASTRIGLEWAGCLDNRVAEPGAEFVCGGPAGIAGFDILWAESVNGGVDWTSPNLVDAAANFPQTASAIWMSTSLRGVLVSHDGRPISFRRGFEPA